MTICAGYISADRRLDYQSLQNSVQHFSVLNDGRTSGDVTQVVETKYGHQICKYDRNLLIRPCITSDSEGNFLMILGFVNGDLSQGQERDPILLRQIVKNGPETLEKLEGQFVAVFV